MPTSPAPDHPLATLGWDERVAALVEAAGAATHDAVRDEGRLVPGRVIRTSRRFTYLATERGLVQATAPLGLDPAPVAGDWAVVVHGEPGEAELRAVLPRWSALTRRDPAGRSQLQVLAADVDVVLIVLGLDRPLKAGRVERSLVLAWESGATPVLVLTKLDLVADPTDATGAVAALAGEAEVVVVSARTGDGLDRLHELLDGHRSAVLLGESGAGKSTLVNRLAGHDVQRTAEVRLGDAKGRHTTVTRDLVVLPTGGIIIDTPGLRGLGLLAADDGLAAAFADIEEIAQGCRFRDCWHDREPGCAVRQAVADGTLDAERAERYAALQQELVDAEQAGLDAERRRPDRAGGRAGPPGPRDSRHLGGDER